MIRVSEAVLPGHPDKFCDQVADAVIAECHRVDPDAYGQIEVAVWSDQVWLSGGTCTRRPIERSLREIVVDTGVAIGYGPANHVDATRYHVTSTVCQKVGDPRPWSQHVNDQAIVVGWAGYDEKTRHLPPEHFLALSIRDALVAACRGGALLGHGPDGKLLVRLREDGRRWSIEHILVTVQQKRDVPFMDVCEAVIATLATTYEALQRTDRRWVAAWRDIEVLINPNGPMVEAGSDGDNGQTGRKLVMDYYGPRVPIGGGALFGKHYTHIDRLGAMLARRAAIDAIKSGARECLVRVCYAPNIPRPIAIDYEMDGTGERRPADFFDHARAIENASDMIAIA